jgi:hypothetical protein
MKKIRGRSEKNSGVEVARVSAHWQVRAWGVGVREERKWNKGKTIGRKRGKG